MMSQYAATDIGPPHYWDKMPEMCQRTMVNGITMKRLNQVY